MTAVRETTLNLRYQVYANFITGDRSVLINSYTNAQVANRASRALLSGPGTFVTDAWAVDSWSVTTPDEC